MKCFFPPHKFCGVYIHFTGYQMKAYNFDLINILMKLLENKGDLLLKLKHFVIYFFKK